MNTDIAKHRFVKSGDSREAMGKFWNVHVKPVIDISMKIARKYKGDLERCRLAAMFHDYLWFKGFEPHDELGAKMARLYLPSKGYSESVAAAVSKIILTHRCINKFPKTLDQKILASADALSHFERPFIEWYVAARAGSSRGLLRMLELDLEKIFFQKEKEEAKEEFERVKRILSN